VGVSITGLAGGVLGLLAFLLPRLWIGIAYLKGEGAETDESLREFWEFAAVSLVYVPAIAAALAVPPAARWAVMLLVAGVAQALAFPLDAAQPGVENVPLLALPATLLLLLGATTSFRRWRESRGGGGGLALKGGKR
jgi:hypothetical protein